ncbi:Uncharacterised protein [Shigella sonnei]|nr:Uncharacterised protein [Shigella sonnei]CSP97375.1 Uncharacterised protein [Shigella sonnei]CSS64935.1 Uncharacterised protein [Shigella sonnei]
MFVGFHQVVVGIAVVSDIRDIAARDNDRIDRQRRCTGKGSGYRQHRTVIRSHFTHSGVEQFGMNAFGLQGLENGQKVCRSHFIIK